ncbi:MULTISPECIES: F0F1 ATP synthase subunit epsilon [Halocynthiibacter]|uniref:ATP synthase epsilon chain n=1 Tax=Halocynthiibacter halioticoli TaxID=2986804 RepID=A0AAE3IZC5_9RHOB|nr:MULTISPECIES: F0F1 ATP synthase subunit epsilon [Halocynthiibacter]MCV6823688.1 F0F1 ATP synthase subunit epsilon [Halocynthiibacter halioticoli]MCW4056689.1 F0F1 ATP synthase subunit epsilon [Halocynthiibacter sp. SDUM655004]MDE0590294.1 F0F1 ATP synthase subunit epsilon [Halocynthiibacter sp. C4]
MADTLQFDLVSPERSLASFQATEVQIPGAEGDLTAMADHAPLITTLRPGILKVVGKDGTQEFVVTGGFAEISAEATSVLAERAMPVAEATQEVIDEVFAEFAAARETISADRQDALNKQVADLNAIATQLGLATKSA